MNKYQITYFFLFLMYILSFFQGCTKIHDENFFYFVNEIYPDASYKFVNNKILIVKNISLEEFNTSTDKFLKNKFIQWHKADNSSGFIIGVDGKIIFKGTNKKAIIYSKSKEQLNRKYIPVILFDINEETLYCVLSTDFGG